MRFLLLLVLVLAEVFPGQIQPSVARSDDDLEEVVHIKLRPSKTMPKTIHLDTEPSDNLHDAIRKTIRLETEGLRPRKSIRVDTSGLRSNRLHDTVTNIIYDDTGRRHPSRRSRDGANYDADAMALYDAILKILQDTDSSRLHDAIAKVVDDYLSGRLSISGSGGRYSLGVRGRLRSGVSVNNNQRGYCQSGWTYWNITNSCYKTFFDQNWSGAESICVLLGGHLTSIHTPEENLFVADLSKANMVRPYWTQATWIGLHQANFPSSKEWTWTDGTKVDYSPFAPGEPNNSGGHEQCGQLYSDEPYLRQWNDWPCDTKMRNFVCKKESFPLL